MRKVFGAVLGVAVAVAISLVFLMPLGLKLEYHLEYLHEAGQSSDAVVILLLVKEAIIVLFLLAVFLIVRAKTRCPKCKRWFSIKKVKTVTTGSDPVSVKSSEAIYDRNGKFNGSRDTYIHGTREYYKSTYQCKHCNYIRTKEFSRKFVN